MTSPRSVIQPYSPSSYQISWHLHVPLQCVCCRPRDVLAWRSSFDISCFRSQCRRDVLDDVALVHRKQLCRAAWRDQARPERVERLQKGLTQWTMDSDGGFSCIGGEQWLSAAYLFRKNARAPACRQKAPSRTAITHTCRWARFLASRDESRSDALLQPKHNNASRCPLLWPNRRIDTRGRGDPLAPAGLVAHNSASHRFSGVLAPELRA